MSSSSWNVCLAILLSVQQVAGQLSSATSAPSAVCSGSTTISHASDGFTLAAGCPTYSGSVAIATSVTEAIELDGLQEIQGSFYLDNATQLSSISSNSLHTIGDTLFMNELMILSSFDFGNLTTVSNLILSGLPNQQSLSFLETLQRCDNISIQNTQIDELKGFNLEEIGFIVVANNPFMESLNLQVERIKGSVTVAANGQDLAVSFPNLQTVLNMTLSNVSDVNVPSMVSINDTLDLRHSYMTELKSPLLYHIDGSLLIEDNQNLSSLTLPSLITIAKEWSLQNNTNLLFIDSLGTLATIGSVDIVGPVKALDLPNLSMVEGDFFLNSSEGVNCSQFAQLASQQVIAGSQQCFSQGELYTPLTVGNASTTSDNPSATSTASDQSQKSDLSIGAIAGIGVAMGAVGVALLGVLIWFFLRRRKRIANKVDKSSPESSEMMAEKDGDEIDGAVMLSAGGEKHELEQPVTEMPVGHEAQELPAKHGTVEVGRSLSTKAPAGIEQRHEMPANEVPAGWRDERVVKNL